MTVLQRAATLAAMTLAVVGLATSTTGRAAETATPVINAATTSALPVMTITAPELNLPTAIAVPTPDPTANVASAGATTSFSSLAAAVAANAVTGDADDALHCLAGAIYFEAKGEPLHGQLGVAEVILNRAKSGRFASDICSVVTQRGQFSFVRSGRIPAISLSNAAYRTALAVARVALNEMWQSPAAEALYFNAHRAPSAGLRRIASIGNHHFYR